MKERGLRSAFLKSITTKWKLALLVQRLLKPENFRRAYELTPELTEKLRSVGIEGDFGEGGLRMDEWPTFGSVIKTMTEFTNAYIRFREKCVGFVREMAKRSLLV